MHVLDIRDSLQEVSKVGHLAEASQLRDVIKSDVDDSFYASLLQGREELLGGFLGKPDGCKLNGHLWLVCGCFRVSDTVALDVIRLFDSSLFRI